MTLRSLATVLRTRRYLVGAVILVALLCSPFLVTLLSPTFVAVSQLSYVGSGSSGSASSLTNAILPTTDLPDLVMSTDVIAEAMRRLGLHGSVDDVRLVMSVKSSPHSNVVPIVVRLKNPAYAVELANTLADASVDQYKVIAARQYDEVLRHLTNQLNQMRNEIRFNDAKLQTSLQSDYSVGATDSLDNITKHIDELEGQRGTAYANYVADSAAMNAEVAGSSADRADLASAIHEQILSTDLNYQAVKSLESKDSAQLASVEGGYTDAFPGLPGLQEKVKDEKRAVEETQRAAIREHPGNSTTYAAIVLNQHNAAALAAGDKARIDAIDQNITEAKSRLADLPRVGVAANMFRLQRDSASAAYQQVEVRYQQTLVDRAEATALGAAFVLDHANAAYPRIPRPLMAIILTLLIVSLAIGIAYLAEAIDPRIRTTTDVEDLYGTSRIGSV
jgi:capsular polysaccharide biosynthesis protein